MNDTALHQLKKTWEIEYKIMEKLIKKLHNQLRAQKELRVLQEMMRKCKQVLKDLGDLIQEDNREKRVQAIKQFFKLCTKTMEVCQKYGQYCYQYIERKFLLEFSSISFACSSRFYYLLKEIHPFLNKIFKREKALLQSDEIKEQQKQNNTIVIN
ncbi:hypothetical protein ABPG74_009464 [Tetrahymena malaccensis]